MNSVKYLLTAVFFGLLLTLNTQDVQAQTSTDKGQVGLGIMVGEPTGLSFKYWMGSKTAIDAGLTWSLSGNDAIGVHTDYVWHKWLNVEKGQLALYYGVGASLWLADNNTGLGARIPVGLNYLFQEAPLDLFIEVVPGLGVVPDTDFDVDGGIGVRYYF